MALSKYSGMQETMPQNFSSMLDRFFNESVNTRRVAGFTPSVDAFETDNGYEIEMALPGVKKEDINIDFQEGRLTISGERRFERKEDSKRYHMVETQYGTFSRTFFLPDNVQADKISAQFEDGILLVSAPKDVQKTMKRQIQISSGSQESKAGGSKQKKQVEVESNGKSAAKA
ncbi:Hsp20/alpha crystallin family protein [Pontibacter vulgaris]|uniref:Hsp20/alpha crystallin family protein n=1 Tax=Pontibacter vulgaris TaxID=2905679 RepID=UPI001FA7CD2B|nr:Hsp20/alpha crystallin family protein [Pontibacter vulgaris]